MIEMPCKLLFYTLFKLNSTKQFRTTFHVLIILCNLKLFVCVQTHFSEQIACSERNKNCQ